MNRADINQTGGYKLVTNDFAFIQDAYSIFNAFTGLAGDLTIISGCEINGSVVSSGFVAINGEVLPFLGGAISENVIIKETRSSRAFDNGQLKEVYIDRVAKFGTGTTVYKWVDFVKIPSLKEVAEKIRTATVEYQGIIQLATAEEVLQGDDENKAITPATLPNNIQILDQGVKKYGQTHDDLFDVTIPFNGNGSLNYQVLLEIEQVGGTTWVYAYTVQNKTSSSFKIHFDVQDRSGGVGDINIRWTVIKH